MGRYETLNADTKDVVDAILPAIAKSFKVDEVRDIIPEDIRMRAWDCERRDHIKDRTEDDPRNWGVQFLKELRAIARMNGGDLQQFQEMLRGKVAKHEGKHPWCRLADIKEIKIKLEHPDIQSEPERDQEGFIEEGSSGEDSYLEELVEPELPKEMKRGRKPRNVEMYEARAQPKHRKRLRRADGSWARPEKKPSNKGLAINTIRSREGSENSNGLRAADSPFALRSPSAATTFGPRRLSSAAMSEGLPSSMMQEINNSDVPVSVLKIQAEIEEAEVELKLARAKTQYLALKEKAEAEARARAASRPEVTGERHT